MKSLRISVAFVLTLGGLFSVGCGRSAHDTSTDRSAATHTPAPALVVREIDSPAGTESREPEMFATADGRIILSWVEKVGEKRYALRFATRGGGGAGWSEAGTIASGDNWFVNWADFPSVVALTDSSLAAHWLVKSGKGTYAYDVNVALSNDGGKSWGKPMRPHTDGTQTEHGFVSLLPLSDGRLGAVWLDGRNFKGVKHEEEDAPSPADMTLRYAAIDTEGKLSDEAVLDERVCECCQTAAAMTSEGALVVYRDRSEREVRDVYFVRRQKDGSWSAPRAVHADRWEVGGCPVNGPTIAAEGRRAAVAWYTEADERPRVQIAFSDDAGASFGSPVQVDDGNPVGRVDVLMLADGSALVCWLSGTEEGGAIKARRVGSDGALGAASIVAETNIARSSGFPRMARLGDEVVFAWTQFGKPSRVRTASARLDVER
jgi:hypothetical protein